MIKRKCIKKVKGRCINWREVKDPTWADLKAESKEYRLADKKKGISWRKKRGK